MDELATVVIADADQGPRQMLAASLTKAGFRVLQAETGEQALALARTSSPGAVVLEVPLGSLSGYEVCHALRAELGPDLPIMFLSGARTESYDRVAGLLLGADDYLVKPYADGELIARLTNLYRRSRARTLGEARRLTKRELEVLDLLGDGHASRRHRADSCSSAPRPSRPTSSTSCASSASAAARRRSPSPTARRSCIRTARCVSAAGRADARAPAADRESLDDSRRDDACALGGASARRGRSSAGSAARRRRSRVRGGCPVPVRTRPARARSRRRARARRRPW